MGIYAVESGPDAIRGYIEEIGTFVLWLLERGYRPRIVIGDAEYDEGIRVELREWFEKKNVVHEVVDERASSFEELMAQLAQADLVVATRFHNVLLSLMKEKPVLSVSHMDKNDQLMAAMGLGAYSLAACERAASGCGRPVCRPGAKCRPGARGDPQETGAVSRTNPRTVLAPLRRSEALRAGFQSLHDFSEPPGGACVGSCRA